MFHSHAAGKGNVVTETEVAKDELEHGYADSATHILYKERKITIFPRQTVKPNGSECSSESDFILL